MRELRRVTRNKVWHDTIASIEFSGKSDKKRKKANAEKLKAKVDNISSRGMFILTDNFIPAETELSILISFSDYISISAKGRVIRKSKEGTAIIFTMIDPAKLGECIISRLNQTQTS